VMAIYPGWWGDFPLWFGRPITGVSVRGNVICGGLTKMIYEAVWDALDREGEPSKLREGERVVDAVDLGDVVSEGEHAFRIDGAPGHVAMKLLPHPRRPGTELWDAGRVLPPGARIGVALRGFVPSRSASLLFRLAPPGPGTLAVEVGKEAHLEVTVRPRDGWVELSVLIAADRVEEQLDLHVSAPKTELVLYHLWGIQSD